MLVSVQSGTSMMHRRGGACYVATGLTQAVSATALVLRFQATWGGETARQRSGEGKQGDQSCTTVHGMSKLGRARDPSARCARRCTAMPSLAMRCPTDKQTCREDTDRRVRGEFQNFNETYKLNDAFGDNQVLCINPLKHIFFLTYDWLKNLYLRVLGSLIMNLNSK